MNRSSDSYDLLILGSGSAAFSAAIKASEMGARVALSEYRQVGGTCVNRGCIPSKNLIRAAEMYEAAGGRRFPGLTGARHDLDFPALIAQKDELVESLRSKKYLDVLEGNERLTLLRGQTRFVRRDEVEIGGRRFRAPNYLIATGCSTRVLPLDGLSEFPYLTSDLLTSGEPMELRELPPSLLIIGGGFIGCELGQMFAHLGAKVTILEIMDQLLPGFDSEVSHTLRAILIDEGVEVVLQAQPLQVWQEREGVCLKASANGRGQQYRAAQLLLAAGFVANTADLGLEVAGVDTDKNGFVRVDAEMRTTAPHVWAAGDVTGPPFATPVGAREGVIAAENIMDPNAHKSMDYRAVPRAVFTTPEVASVGLTVEEAKARGLRVRASCLDLSHVPRAAAVRDTRGVVKMVIDEDSERVLGVHLVAYRGAEIIHEAALAVKQNLTIHDLIETIHVYPTMAEAIRMVAQTFLKDVTKLSCCAE